jgi:3-mercaptopyruvate sulfurtransferase SseA
MKKYLAILRHGIVLLPMLFLATSLTLTGCGGGGSDSYDEPAVELNNAPLEGHATNVVIEPVTLKGWMDAGLVNAGDSFDGKVVIFDYASADTALRIPGAFKVSAAEFTATRLEGIAQTGTLVPTGATMDAIIQRLGIDENTTIVFTTTGSSQFQSTRAYFTFRYWGFPIERLKILNGGNGAWDFDNDTWGDAYALTPVVPASVASTYSVRDLGKLNDDLRMSIGEMITQVVPALQAGTMFHLDALGQAHAEGTSFTTDLLNATKYVAFEGRIRGSGQLSQGNLFDSANQYRFKPAATILGLFEAAGWTGLPTTVACRAGVSCNGLYVGLEAILGAPVYTFDGSWGMWGLYSNSAANGGKIPALTGERARWATDQYTISGPMAAPVDAPVYNVGRTVTIDGVPTVLTTANIAPLLIDLNALYNTNGPADPAANQVENADREYITTPPAGGAPGSSSGGSGGGC